MKKIILLLLILGLSVSCLKDDKSNIDANKISVEQYISRLKSNEFYSDKAPVFEIEDIPELLKHAYDEQKISNYPSSFISSVSSIRPEETEVGFVILWTIEGTRLDVDYPSSGPHIYDMEKIKVGNYQYAEPSLQKVAEIYERWWKENKNRTSAELKEISPLDGTNLEWH